MKQFFLLALCLLAVNVKAQQQENPLLTYKLLYNKHYADTAYANKPHTYTIWKADTVAQKLHWFEELGTLNDYYNAKISNKPRRVVAFSIKNKNEWQIEYKPDSVYSDGGSEFGYGMIISAKVDAEKIEIQEKNSCIPIYFYFENNKANELTKAFINNPLLAKISTHWVTAIDSQKTENVVKYELGYNGIGAKIGRHLKFNTDGSFIDNYYAMCGLDGNIHTYTGKWKITDKNIIDIFDLVENNNKAHWISVYEDDSDMIVLPTGKFKILDVKDNALTLQIIDNYEQKASNKVKRGGE
jgi:hypothetical protein